MSSFQFFRFISTILLGGEHIVEDKHEQSRIPVRQCANGEVFQHPEDIFLLKWLALISYDIQVRNRRLFPATQNGGYVGIPEGTKMPQPLKLRHFSVPETT